MTLAALRSALQFIPNARFALPCAHQQEEPFVFLAKSADPSVINKALLYVRDNEQTSRVLVVRKPTSHPSIPL